MERKIVDPALKKIVADKLWAEFGEDTQSITNAELREIAERNAERRTCGGRLSIRFDELRQVYTSRTPKVLEQLPNQIEGKIYAKNLVLGVGVRIGKDTIISGLNGQQADRVFIGDFATIGAGARVFTRHFSVGEYTQIWDGFLSNGSGPVQIGRHCWFGRDVTVDPQGSAEIYDGVGIGADSQVWGHAVFGDVVQGCRFHSDSPLIIKEDAWLVGHSLTGPVTVDRRGMAMLGSTITKNIFENHIVGGSPAKDITDKVGFQYEELPDQEKMDRASVLVELFEALHPEHAGNIKIFPVESSQALDASSETTVIDPISRFYRKRLSAAEVAFFQMVGTNMKLYPYGEPPVVVPSEY